MAMFVPAAASTAAEMAVNGGAMTMSQCLAPATKGANAEKNARVSPSVLYIFQLPAITRRRTDPSREEKDNAETQSAQRNREEDRRSFVGQRLNAREFAPGEEFKRGATAGGDMRDFVRNAGLMDGSDGIPAADN